jgi:hypothetical protein
MTLTVNSTLETVSINSIDIPATGKFVLMSGLSREPEELDYTRTLQNARYSTIDITFPADFKDRHANGVYYYSINSNNTAYEKGYIKLITDPGGDLNQKPFNSGAVTEERESVVYYRPTY